MSVRPTFKETQLNFRKPNDEFATLQNVVFDLRTSDGDFADQKAVALRKRFGTQKYGNEISASGETHTLLSYSNNTNDYLISGHGTNLYKFVETTLFSSIAIGDTVINLVDGSSFAFAGDVYIGTNKISYTGNVANQLTGVTGITASAVATTRVIQRIWHSMKAGLSDGAYFTGAVMNSYSGTASVTGTVTPKHTGTWTSVVYDENFGYTTLTDNTKSWEVDALIGRKVKVNTVDYPDLEYTIVENGAIYIRVEGDIKGGNTTTVDDIAYSTLSAAITTTSVTVPLVSSANFRVSGGVANIENDIINYTGIAGNSLTGVTDISLGHSIGAACSSGEVVLNSISGFGLNGGVKIGGYDCYYNGTEGKKLLNLSNVETTILAGATVTNSNYKTAVGKGYEIEFVTVSTRVVDTTKSWTDDAYVGYTVHLSSGKGVGQQRFITSNKKDYLELAFPWEEEPDATTHYSIYHNTDQILYMGNGVDSMIRFDGTTATDITDAPRGNMMISYQSRIFIAKDFTVNYSDVGDPEYFPPMFTITPLGDDKITGLGEWNGNGIIFKERSIWKFNFSWNTQSSQYDVNLEQIPSNSGCISHRTIQKVENVLWFYDGKAIKYLGSAPNQIGVIRTEDISFPIYQGLGKISDAMKLKTVSIYDGYNYLMFTVQDTIDDVNNFGYDYDTAYTGWTTRKGNNAASVVLHKGVRYYGSAEKGQVFEMDVEGVYTDDGTPVDMIVDTKDTDLKNPGIFKTFRFGVYGFENEDSSVEYAAKVYTTRNTLTREGEWDIGFGLEATPTLGDAMLGEGSFGAAAETPRRIVRKVSIGFSGTRIQHRLRNRKNEKLTITDISTVWYARSMRHFPTVLIS